MNQLPHPRKNCDGSSKRTTESCHRGSDRYRTQYSELLLCEHHLEPNIWFFADVLLGNLFNFLLSLLQICFMMLVSGITDETYRIKYDVSYL
jgi:hypothetical protein